MDHVCKVVAPHEEEAEFELCLGKFGAWGDAGWQIPKPESRGAADGRAVEDSRELIAATVAGCFSMLLTGMLTRQGHPPRSVDTRGAVDLCTAGKPVLSKLYLHCSASVPGMSDAAFQAVARKARSRVSESLNSVEIVLKTHMMG